jgi:hypothetical protein
MCKNHPERLVFFNSVNLIGCLFYKVMKAMNVFEKMREIAAQYKNNIPDKRCLYIFTKHKNGVVAEGIVKILNARGDDESVAAERVVWRDIITELGNLAPSLSFHYLPGVGFHSNLLNSYISLLEKRVVEITGKYCTIDLYHEGSASIPKGLPSIRETMLGAVDLMKNTKAKPVRRSVVIPVG